MRVQWRHSVCLFFVVTSLCQSACAIDIGAKLESVDITKPEGLKTKVEERIADVNWKQIKETAKFEAQVITMEHPGCIITCAKEFIVDNWPGWEWLENFFRNR